MLIGVGSNSAQYANTGQSDRRITLYLIVGLA
jgi:hypothetical protein